MQARTTELSASNGRCLSLAVPDALVDAIASRVADVLADRFVSAPSPWLSVDEAADYLRCSKQRVYDQISSGALKPARDGRRVLLRHEWLDVYLKRGGAA